MAKTKYHILLTSEQKMLLNQIIDEGKESERTIMRARILLESDEITGSHLSLVKLAAKLGTTDTTIQTTRTEFAQKGLEASVYKKHHVFNDSKKKINKDVIKKIIELAKMEPSDGKNRWSIRRLCIASVERGIVDSISIETMHKLLKEYGIGLK